MFEIRQKGDFSKVTNYFERLKEKIRLGILDKYGRQGVKALSEATPRDTGKTASSWDYRIERNKNSVSLVFTNSNVQNGVPIAILIQYDHSTRNGGYVQGRDYINPALRPTFDQLAREAWKEVTNV